MKKFETVLHAIVLYLSTALVALSADTNAPVKLTAPPTSTGFYGDAGLSLRTTNFKKAKYGYGVGVGYQVSEHWGGDIRFGRKGLDVIGSGIQDIGGRLVARMPWQHLSPYVFVGGTFDLERDCWSIQPGAGIELIPNKEWRGLSLFGEAAVDAPTDTALEHGWLFSGGVRWRF
jgi:hypothetical protein